MTIPSYLTFSGNGTITQGSLLHVLLLLYFRSSDMRTEAGQNRICSRRRHQPGRRDPEHEQEGHHCVLRYHATGTHFRHSPSGSKQTSNYSEL